MTKGKRGFQPGNTYGQAFSSNYQPKKNGRKPVLYTKILQTISKKENAELSKEDYFNVIRYLMERTPGELKRIQDKTLNDPESTIPVWVANLISAIFSDIKKGKMNVLNLLFDRLFEKQGICIKAQHDVYRVNNRVNNPISNLSKEEIEELDLLISKLSTK